MRRTRLSKSTTGPILALLLVPLLIAGTAAAETTSSNDQVQEAIEDGAETVDETLAPVRELWDQAFNVLTDDTPFEGEKPEFPDVSEIVTDDAGTSNQLLDTTDSDGLLPDGRSVKAQRASYGARTSQHRTPIPSAETASGLGVPLAYAATIAAGLGLLLLGPLTMYRRVKKSQALDNDVRHSIYKFVENNPGATVTEIAEGVGVSHSTATYHIKILQEFDLIKKRRDGNSLHIFPSDAALDKKEALLLSYMRERETREIIRSIYANPWTYPSELARSLDMSRSSAQWHLEKLEDSGIVNVVRDGKFSYLYIEPEMKDTVEDHLVQ